MAVIISIIGLKSKKALGGITGDILGAIAFLTELVFLFIDYNCQGYGKLIKPAKLYLIRHAPVKQIKELFPRTTALMQV